MEVALSDILEKMKHTEAGLKRLEREIRDLESEKQGYLEQIMKGARRSLEIRESGEAIREKRLALSKVKEQVGNLRAQLETRLSRFRKDLIEERQKELDHHMKQRGRYQKRIDELEVEASRYRYLITGKKDQRLANVKSILPSEIEDQEGFVPIDEAIGQTKLEVSRINRMRSDALLGEYLARKGR